MIKQQTISKPGIGYTNPRYGIYGPKKPKIARNNVGGLIASGVPVRHGGRIAGGAPGITNPKTHQTHAPRVYLNPLGFTPGGLIDKKQQIDPSKTVFSHPFSGGTYLSISSQQILPPIGNWNGFNVRMEATPELQPHEKGTFFQKKITPPVKMQFGTNQTGRPPDTAFQRQPKLVLPRPNLRSMTPTEKLTNTQNLFSFVSYNHLRADPLNSTYGDYGRWGKIKRSASEVTRV